MGQIQSLLRTMGDRVLCNGCREGILGVVQPPHPRNRVKAETVRNKMIFRQWADLFLSSVFELRIAVPRRMFL